MYGIKQPLRVAGTFTADVLVGNRMLNEVEFVVIESEGHTLLERETAIALGVLKLEPQINSLQFSPDRENREPNILDKFPGCCEGIGKLKDFQLKIPIDAEVQLVAQPIRRDVIVHAATEEEHDQRFWNVVRVLTSKGLTLNRDKCQFKVTHLEFMGDVLSARGTGPTDVKVKAVVEAREPKNVVEVRSFLGFVNFTARFIPDLSTVSTPLGQLTKNGEPFVWDQEQQQSTCMSRGIRSCFGPTARRRPSNC